MTFTVTLSTDSTPVEVYGGLPAALHYLNYSISDGAAAFRGLSADDQARMLVAATRYIDRLEWQGSATTPAVGGTVLQWPRSNVVDATGASVSSATVPQNILDAVFELAGTFSAEQDFETYRDPIAALTGVSDGSVRLNYSVPVGSQENGGPQLPPIVLMLVAQYFPQNVTRVMTTGTDGVSQFDVDDASGVDNDPFAREWPI